MPPLVGRETERESLRTLLRQFARQAPEGARSVTAGLEDDLSILMPSFASGATPTDTVPGGDSAQARLLDAIGPFARRPDGVGLRRPALGRRVVSAVAPACRRGGSAIGPPEFASSSETTGRSRCWRMRSAQTRARRTGFGRDSRVGLPPPSLWCRARERVVKSCVRRRSNAHARPWTTAFWLVC